MKNKYLLLLVLICQLCWLSPLYAADQNKAVTPMLSLLLSGNKTVTMQEKEPSLALMVAKDTDKIVMAWIPGSDGITPVDQIEYKIYLSTTKNFTPSPVTLKKTVTGVSQTEITGLATDTLYYGKMIAVYSASTSDVSNSLQTKTYKNKVLRNSSFVVVIAEELGLGKHTTSDGITYTYSGGTPPTPGCILFSEDVAGGIAIRKVVSVSSSGGTITVITSDASLTDALDIGSIYSSFQLFDVSSQAKSMPVSSRRIASARSMTSTNGSQHSSIVWKDRLLSAEQTTYAYSDDELEVIPDGSTSTMKLFPQYSTSQSFTATVTAEFEPQLITAAEWGSGFFGGLDSAQVSAVGTLSLTALAEYNFAASGSVNKEFRLFSRTWVSVYSAGPIPVFQEITLSMNVKASASASAKIKAQAKANLTETVEVGARYDGTSWTPYITHNEKDSLTASLDIVGKANAEIRLIPKIEVRFYRVISSNLTVEPFANSSLKFEYTTNNTDFLLAHPERLIHLTSFDNLLGMQANVGVTLGTLGYTWNALPSTCVLGTDSCLYTFKPYMLFSIPKFELSQTGSSDDSVEFSLEVTDGTHNAFDQGSIDWEVFPDDATVTPESCSKSGNISTCKTTIKYGDEDKYTVFASGHGVLGEVGRQFKETIPGCQNGTGMWKGREWQCEGDGNSYNWEDAKTYCSDLSLAGHSDWRSPTKTELKSLVVCTNGTSTPLLDPDYDNNANHPYFCGDNNSAPYDRPTIDKQFSCHPNLYWSSSVYDEVRAWSVFFGDGYAIQFSSQNRQYVRCVR